jgi:hypothetical protein
MALNFKLFIESCYIRKVSSTRTASLALSAEAALALSGSEGVPHFLLAI